MQDFVHQPYHHNLISSYSFRLRSQEQGRRCKLWACSALSLLRSSPGFARSVHFSAQQPAGKAQGLLVTMLPERTGVGWNVLGSCILSFVRLKSRLVSNFTSRPAFVAKHSKASQLHLLLTLVPSRDAVWCTWSKITSGSDVRPQARLGYLY